MGSDVPVWTEAIATSTGVIVALGIPTVAGVRARMSSKSKQARLVTAWEHHLSLDMKPYPAIFLRVHNGSDFPLFETRVMVSAGVRGTFVRWLGSLGPRDLVEVPIALPRPPRSSYHTPEIVFADINQRAWHRGAMGELKEVERYGGMDILKEDPAGYLTIEDHPTMRLDYTQAGNRAYSIRHITP